MTKKWFLLLLLCVSVFAQETNNENANDVESIPQGIDVLAQAPAQANEENANPKIDLNYGKMLYCLKLV